MRDPLLFLLGRGKFGICRRVVEVEEVRGPRVTAEVVEGLAPQPPTLDRLPRVGLVELMLAEVEGLERSKDDPIELNLGEKG